MKSKMPLHPDRHKYSTQRLKDKLPFDAFVLSISDGDTLQVAKQWTVFPGDSAADECLFSFSQVEFIRLAAIDAPELKAVDSRPALWAQMYLSSLVLGKVVTVRPRRIWRDLYHRIIGTVTFEGRDLGTCLIEAGHARPRKF